MRNFMLHVSLLHSDSPLNPWCSVVSAWHVAGVSEKKIRKKFFVSKCRQEATLAIPGRCVSAYLSDMIGALLVRQVSSECGRPVLRSVVSGVYHNLLDFLQPKFQIRRAQNSRSTRYSILILDTNKNVSMSDLIEWVESSLPWCWFAARSLTSSRDAATYVGKYVMWNLELTVERRRFYTVDKKMSQCMSIWPTPASKSRKSKFYRYQLPSLHTTHHLHFYKTFYHIT